jgi:hypothetical protein
MDDMTVPCRLANPAITVLIVWIWDFEFVSDFGFRVSDLASQDRQAVVDVNAERTTPWPRG